MNTVLTTNHLKFKINANDHLPPHVHIEGGGASLRVNLNTFEVMDAETEFSQSTVKLIILKVMENRILLLEEWERLHGKA